MIFDQVRGNKPLDWYNVRNTMNHLGGANSLNAAMNQAVNVFESDKRDHTNRLLIVVGNGEQAPNNVAFDSPCTESMYTRLASNNIDIVVMGTTLQIDVHDKQYPGCFTKQSFDYVRITETNWGFLQQHMIDLLDCNIF